MSIEIDRRKMLERVEEWSRESEELKERLAWYKLLLRVEIDHLPHVSLPNLTLTKDEIASLQAQGKTPLSFLTLTLDWQRVSQLFQYVSNQLAAENLLPLEKAQTLQVLGQNMNLLRDAVLTWLDEKSLASIAENVGLEVEILEEVIGGVMKPFLTALSQNWAPVLSQGKWARGFCPVCGASPRFAHLEKQDGARWLFCSRCDTQWLSPRLECPFCGNQDQKTLNYYTDEDGLYRLYLCESCKGYLKAIDLRQTEVEVLLPLEVTLTTDMDSSAEEMGYRPGKCIHRA